MTLFVCHHSQKSSSPRLPLGCNDTRERSHLLDYPLRKVSKRRRVWGHLIGPNEQPAPCPSRKNQREHAGTPRKNGSKPKEMQEETKGHKPRQRDTKADKKRG